MSSGCVSFLPRPSRGPSRAVWLAALLLLAVGCRSSATGFDSEDARSVETEVLAATRAFEAAERALDVEAILGFIAPGFYMYQDGRRVGHDEVLEQIRSSLPSLRSFDARWEDVEVLVLGPDTALVSLVFRDEIVDAEGTTSRAWGPTTFLWRRLGDAWRVAYADADHYPPERDVRPE